MTNEFGSESRKSIRPLLVTCSLLAVGLIVAITTVWQILRVQAQPEKVQTIIRVSPDQPLPGMSIPLPESDEDFVRRKRGIAALVKSPLILTSVIEDREVSETALLQRQKRPLTFLQNRLYVEFEPDVELMMIGMRGSQSEWKDLKRVVDAVIEALFDYVDKESELQFLTRLTVLDKELSSLKNMIENLDQDLDEAREKIGEEFESSIECEFLKLELEQARELAVSLTKAEFEFKVANKRPNSIRRLDIHGAALVSK